LVDADDVKAGRPILMLGKSRTEKYRKTIFVQFASSLEGG